MTVKIACVALLLALLPHVAAAFTPEPGIWWNAAEDGRGYAIEIQNDVLILLVFGYDADRTSSFLNSAGRMQPNAIYRGPLDGYAAGQCLTCNYSGRPAVLLGAGGQVEIYFDSSTRAHMIIGGRTIQIERYNFATGDENTKLFGQWQLVVDVSSRAMGSEPRFTADVLNIIKALPSFLGQTTLLGCRPADTTSLICRRDSMFVDISVKASYNSFTGKHTIFVEEGVDPAGQLRRTRYEVNVGLNEFEGVATHLANGVALPGEYPVRGFRSAARYQVRYFPLAD